MARRTYMGETVFIAELAKNPGGHAIIEDVDFHSCHILGPAVLMSVEDMEIQGSTLIADPSVATVIWLIERNQNYLGAVGIVRCKFVNCHFESIGLATLPDEIDAVKAGFGLR
jgi:hypothetical protein